ncbi:MAG: aminotransferase class III-fold pyridoxal phosphate-dependent enzyme [Cyanobacteriota bacterium]
MVNKIVDKHEILENNLKHTIFSWSKQSGLTPINAEKADGVYVWDRDGKRYLDFSSQLMNVNIGHGNKKVAEAVMQQMSELSYVFPGMATKVRGDLGKKLAEITPGSLNRTFFTLGGAEAIENAVKLARMYTGRHKILARYRSYHGATVGAISVGGDPRKFPVDNQPMPNVVHVEDPYCYRCPWSQKLESCNRECIEHIERVIEFENPASIAAIVNEGVSGSSGCLTYPPDYWKRLRELADKHGFLLIDDEVMSGFCRTGQWFGIDNYKVTPDILVMAKGLTSGYIPLGGIVVREEIAKHFEDKPLLLGLTCSAHAVACAAAIAVLDVYEEQNLAENARNMSKYITDKVEEMKKVHLSIGDFRTTGLLGCIELVKNRETREPMAPWNAKPDQMAVMNQVAAKIKELGMFTFVRWNWIFIAPPLIINKEQIDEGLDIISQAISIADKHCN